MADGRRGNGGYQAPSSPAAVSGPGALSARTDGGPSNPNQPIRELPNAKYGEAAEFRALQQGAPLAAAASPQGQAPPPPSTPGIDAVVPFGAPSQRPGEPVTAGAELGPGPGMNALALPPEDVAAMNNLRDALPALELIAASPYASQATRQYVRSVRAAVSGQL